MMRYQINSKRKHFYSCKICSVVFISANALKSHYASLHPNLTIDVQEIKPETYEEDLDDFTMNMNNNFLYTPLKEDIYSFSNPVTTTTLTTLTTSLPPASVVTMNNNNAYSNISFTYTNPMIFTQPTAYALKAISPSNNNNINNNMNNNNNINGNPTANSVLIKCDICMKKFSTIYNKKRHDEMFHKKETNITLPAENKCSVCDKSFTSIYNKKRHEATHKPLDERLKFKCQIDNCNKEYTTQSILKTHLKKVHGIETIVD